jgi:hypothetical protein
VSQILTFPKATQYRQYHDPALQGFFSTSSETLSRLPHLGRETLEVMGVPLEQQSKREADRQEIREREREGGRKWQRGSGAAHQKRAVRHL